MLMPQPIAVSAQARRTPKKACSGAWTRPRLHDGRQPAPAPHAGGAEAARFFRLRFSEIAFRHLLQSAKTALDAGQEEKVVVACLLHDISNGLCSRSDHGYWSAQSVAPYVSEEVAWAVQHHQALRYFADEAAGFKYPDAYHQFFGPDYEPPEYIQKAHRDARNHRWYMTSRLITIYDIYAFNENWNVDPEQFTDIIGRHFKEPKEGLGLRRVTRGAYVADDDLAA